ncbi:LADA_0F02608g1_1 [Lachancea dasiensis]|uniref:Midasin n=1 Tax=Lachancea dasiensis TaxID=1072105 RepID=A0A1G4JIU3_9SACH|nr:LADA_0F02608g1_1 [Lachancea dasiensis]
MSKNQLLVSATVCNKRASLYNGHFAKRQVSDYAEIDFQKSPTENLQHISQVALNSKFPLAYTFIFRPVYLDMVARWALCVSDAKDRSTIVADRLGQAIGVYPETAMLCDYFLDHHHQHLNLILDMGESQPENSLHQILLAYYRFLRFDCERFSRFVAPPALYKLLQGNYANNAIKLLSVKLLSMCLRLAEQATLDLVHKHTNMSEDYSGVFGPYDGDIEVDYRFLELNEAQRLAKYHDLLNAYKKCHFDLPRSRTQDSLVVSSHDLSSLIVMVYGTLIPRISGNARKHDTSDIQEGFVPTEEALASIRALSKSIQLSKPVMLIGKAGSGKTYLIDYLSKYTGAHESMIKIHLGEQTDAKLLLGTYTSGEKPGTFEWRAGVLTTAVKEGRWVLIEDIDKAPTEVISVLLTLLEQRQLSIPSRGETIKAANGFQIIATIRTPGDDDKNESQYKPDLIGIRLWDIVRLKEPGNDELLVILSNKFSALKNLVGRFVETYNAVRRIYSNPQYISMNRGVHPRVVTLRDLVKFCSRVQTIFKNNGIKSAEELIPSQVYDGIFFEAADCFACAIGEQRALRPLVEAIGIALEIPGSRVNLYISKHVPAFEEDTSSVRIGRCVLAKNHVKLLKKSSNDTSFARTNHSLRLMEQIGSSIQMCEPTLLVGETGTGKTTVVQQMAKLLNRKLTVINVSQQTESGDLLGGFKPVNTKTIAVPLLEDFESLFPATFSMKKNERFYTMLHKCFNKNQWKNVVKLLNEAFKLAKNLLSDDHDDSSDSSKKKRKLDSYRKKNLMDRWVEFDQRVKNFEAQYSSIENSFVFNFVEGSLVKAVRNGEWLLLDEVNLASSDTLESISDLLSEPTSRSVLLSEKGQAEPVRAHPDFRIFACMNPATDVGKRDLPAGVRSRFTEIYVHSPDRDITDLLSIIDKYIGAFSASDEWVGNDVAELYLNAKQLAEANKLVDGSNQRPHFSIRTLTRTLIYVRDIVKIYGLRRSLYEGFCMSFLTLLDEKSELLLQPLIEKLTLGRLKNPKSVMSQSPACPGPEYVQFKHYWMRKGQHEIQEQPNYIITPFVEKNMLNLVRATSGRRFPVLIQGPTSAGKTSMIKYLADITGHKFVRINNHEHTDLQEYLGTYMADDTGKLSFREGVLVDALRRGHWVVLDELNLAPTDVLEALNRLLDDNRELFIPETQEVVHPHPDFMLFATQNPPGIYGGRKILSRAFRNRFLELHFDDIPQDELEIILRERCKIAPSYAQKIVEVYRQLSIQRSAMRLFEQKNSFATLRDLFRWALRDAVGYDNLAANGYMLLAERCRTKEEKVVIKNILEKVMKVKLDMESYYRSLENKDLQSMPSSIVWTKAMHRLAVLVSACLKNDEPILLVGETGCGKTTICQLIAEYVGSSLITVNAHQNTETGDILGAQRPNRHRSDIQNQLTALLEQVLHCRCGNYSLDELLALYDQEDKSSLSQTDIERVKSLRESREILFEWSDGPLIQALNGGQFFLLDEISLADDSVLERLNSVLEPERSLLLAEKGGSDSLVQAAKGFQFFATMNPGGDYGKKELSPALRNRFTEIWVPSMEDFEDVQLIVNSKLHAEVSVLSKPIVEFSKWFGEKYGGGNTNNGVISLRDILSWVEFANFTAEKLQNSYAALVQGAAMVFIDTLGTNNTAYLSDNAETLKSHKLDCLNALSHSAGAEVHHLYQKQPSLVVNEHDLQVGLFSLKRTSLATHPQFNLNAPTTMSNLMRVVRAMQVNKPILLEGSPGVGKTSLVSALAECTGNKLTRINLSEQTDLVDLFGSDAPGERTGEFVWRDAPFLRAMQLGEWVLLDEMNLASQSVLEGLNACLDHRGEAYVPELDKSFSKHPNFTVFAAQNPQHQGGGRKGLPKSFVNRFSVVYVDLLTPQDLFLIATHLFPNIDHKACAQLIDVIATLENEVSDRKLWGHSGSPWEFNLRDTLRWLKLLDTPSLSNRQGPIDYLDMILTQRFRTDDDRIKAKNVFERFFGKIEKRESYFQLTPEYLQVNGELALRDAFLNHTALEGSISLQCNFGIYESVLRCVNRNWPLVLCGPTNSGKTEIIKYMSGILGKKLVSFPMNSDIDSMDILGGYEQVDLNRKVSQSVERLVTSLRQLIAINLGSESSEEDAKVTALELLHFLTTRSVEISELEQFLPLVEKLTYFSDDERIGLALADFRSLLKKRDVPSSVTFEWFDGLLLKAMEEGSWLVLENANLCSPSVLDRLNSLLETNGSLIINECSLADGRPRIVDPNPNFRLFLTVDPKFGELSRAMRNRSIEIHVDKLAKRATSYDKATLGREFFAEAGEADDGFEGIMSCTPLCRFVPADNSEIMQFSKLHDIGMISNPNTFEAVVSILPQSAFFALDGWMSNVEQTSYFVEGGNVEKYVRYAGYLNKIGVLQNVSHLSRQLVSKFLNQNDFFGVSQPLLPSLNSYVAGGIAMDCSAITSSEPLYFFEVARKLCNFAQQLDDVSRRAQHVKLRDLNYLELSAAYDIGRAIKRTPQIPIFKVLAQLYKSIVEMISSNELFIRQKVYKDCFDLCAIWIGAFDTSKTHNLSKLRAYQELLFNWHRDATYQNSSSQEVLEMAQFLGSSLSMDTGRSITLIWNAFRTNNPGSNIAWNQLEKLISVSQKFDEVVQKQFSDSYDLISNLRYIILSLKADIVSDTATDFDGVLETLQNGISELESISKRFLNQRKHHFRPEFDALMRVLCHTDNAQSQTTRSLVSYSSLKSETFLELQKDKLSHPAVFELLWTKDDDGKFHSFTGSVFDSSILETIVTKVTSFKSISGSQIPQAVEDASVLQEKLMSCSSLVLSDKINISKKTLFDWYKKLVSVHVDIKASATLDEIQEVLSDCNDEWFKRIHQDFLLAAVVTSLDCANLFTLGKAWILFSAGALQLFAPSTPFDPAIRDYVLFDNYQIRVSMSKELALCWEHCRRALSGDEPMSMELSLECTGDIVPPSKPRVYRPERPIDPLFEEWNAFIRSTVGLESVRKLMAALEMFDSMSDSQLNLFQQNSSQFLDRLNSNYRVYSDLNDIFRGYVLGMKFGFDLMRQGKPEERKSVKLSPLWAIDSHVITCPHQINTSFGLLKKLFSKKTVNNLSVERISIFYLKLFSFHGKDSRLVSTFENSLQTLYYRWSMRRLQEEKTEQGKSGIYKYDDTDFDVESDFKNMFPDYEDVVLVNASGTQVPSDVTVLNDLYFEIATTYLNLFNSESQLTFTDMIAEGCKISGDLTEIGVEYMSHSPRPSTLTPVLHQLSREVKSFQLPRESENLDFYRDSSVYETKRAGAIVEKVWILTDNLLSQWPEHSTLNDLSRVCREFMEYSADTPIARLLQKIEQIFTIVTEWEKYASVAVSLATSVRELTNLVVSWRKLELSTWSRLFDYENHILNKSVGRWWFHLFETIMVAAPNENSADAIEVQDDCKLLGSLNIFISKCTLGEFGGRLALIKAFANHCILAKCKAERTTHSLLNVVTFYEQFLPIVESSLEDGRKKLEKEISDIILLASWKDVNIDALKQSSHRSHNNLYKIVRKYRTLLSQSVLPIIESGLQSLSKASFELDNFSENMAMTYEAAEMNRILSNISSWNDRPSALKNLDLSTKNMSYHCSVIEAEEYPDFTIFAKDVWEDADRLRKETPKVYNKREKKLLAALKIQKAKLLNDSLKELKRMGLKTGFRDDIRKVQESVTLILSSIDSFRDSALAGCDAQFFRILELIPRLRFVASSPAEDAPLPAIERGMAVFENLVFLLISSRGTFRDFAENFSLLAGMRSRLEQVAVTKDVLMHRPLAMSFDNYSFICKWLPKLLNYASETLSLTFSTSEENPLYNVISGAAEKVMEYQSLIHDQQVFDGGSRALLIEFSEFCDDLSARLLKASSSKTAFLARIVIEWLAEQRSSLQFDESLENAENIEIVDQSFRRVNTSIMLTIQKLLQDKPEKIVMDEDSWLTSSHQRINSVAKRVTSSKVTMNMKDALDLICSQKYSKRTSRMITAIVQFTMPMLSRYNQLLVCLMNRIKCHYDTVSHGTIILGGILYNLGKSGFCSPSPPDEETEDQNLQDGSGLGDGDGAQNNSNDVEEDEDLLENAQQPDKEQEKKEDQDEDEENAVDMEGDMAGDLEQASGEDDSEDHDDDEEEDLDEEVDDLDEDDPNALDEKMWNEDAKESDKEKEANQAPQNSNEDDVQAAEGNEDNSADDRQENQERSEIDEQDKEEEREEQNSEPESNEEDEGVGQDDEVRNDESDQLENHVPEVETMDLPEDMDLDSGEEESGDENHAESEGELDDGMSEENKEQKEEDDDEEGQGAEGEESALPDENRDSIEDENEADEDKEDIDIDEQEHGEDSEEVDSGNKDDQENDNAASDAELANEEDTANDNKTGDDMDTQEAGGEDNSEEKLEGLDGVEDMMEIDSQDFESTVQQQSGAQGKGADAANDEEDENVGSSGNAQQQQNEDSKDEINENSRQEAKESLKQLGDSLKEFHRRHQEIKEATSTEDKQEESASNDRPDEFEHVEGADADTNTQALGSANQDQTTAIDEEKAIDDDMEDLEHEDKQEEKLEDSERELQAEESETRESLDQPQDKDSQGKTKSAFAESQRNLMEQSPLSNLDMVETDMNDLDEIIDAIDRKIIIEETSAVPPRALEEARQLWRTSEIETAELAAGLGEQLRLILEPTLATKLRGDYKTGKRLNMKRIIPYIASQFRKDKIWLRRTKPSKRQYQIMIAVDDSKSMSESKSVDLAFQSICLVSKALTQLESGGLSIVKFGDTTHEVHQFDQTFGVDAGAKIFQWFDFQDTRTDVKKLVAESLRIFDRGRATNNADLWQLQIIISDGVCEDHDTIQRLVRRARDNKIMLVFVIVDGVNSSESIMDMSQVKYVPDQNGNLQLQVEKYLDTFPFEFYVVVHDISELPEMLSIILRQYFSELASA